MCRCFGRVFRQAGIFYAQIGRFLLRIYFLRVILSVVEALLCAGAGKLISRNILRRPERVPYGRDYYENRYNKP